MSTKNDPAFPSALYDISRAAGLTKLEWFAGMALQGMCANNNASFNQAGPDMLAQWAFDQAVAMIAEAEKRK